jgi:hypothetical protein
MIVPLCRSSASINLGDILALKRPLEGSHPKAIHQLLSFAWVQPDHEVVKLSPAFRDGP